MVGLENMVCGKYVVTSGCEEEEEDDSEEAEPAGLGQSGEEEGELVTKDEWTE